MITHLLVVWYNDSLAEAKSNKVDVLEIETKIMSKNVYIILIYDELLLGSHSSLKC